jgi:tubulin monoglycylase TTLL3/8
MIDDKYNVWLIEVNSSPTMEYSTKITERMVKNVMMDTAKVIVDWREASKNVFFFIKEKKEN